MKRLAVTSILLCLALASAGAEPAASTAAPAAPEAPAPATPAALEAGLDIRGPLAGLRPTAAQLRDITARLLMRGIGIVQAATEGRALRDETLGLLVGEAVPRADEVNARIDQMGAALGRLADGVADAIADVLEILSPDQRQMVADKVAMRLLSRRARPPKAAGRAVERIRERMPLARAAAAEIGITTEQRAQLKRIVIGRLPHVDRAVGDIVAQAMAVLAEILKPTQSRDVIKAAAQTAAKRITEIARHAVAAFLEGRAVLSRGQFESAVAKVPMRLLALGPLGLR